ncbi:MAG: PilN domain-containing protein [Polaromonas sp.]
MAINISTDNYWQTLGQLKKTLLASRFMRWWLGELSSMVPRHLKPASLDAESLPLVRHADAVVWIDRFHDGQTHNADSFSLESADPDALRSAFLAALDKMGATRRDVVLVLPPARVLRKVLTLPLATEENLRQVLEFQMEEYTPFPASRLYFGYRVQERDFERGQLQVEWVATPRDGVDASIKTLNDWGATVRAVTAQETLQAGSLLNLLPTAQVKANFSLLQGVNRWLAGLLLMLALAAMAAPLLIKREAVVQLLPWLEKGKTAAETVDTLKRDLEARVDEHNYLLEKRQTLVPVTAALEELTRVLPDDTWVQQLDIKGNEMVIQGETASSVRLIGLFEQSGTFYDASFRSPLTKGQASGAERYQLALQMHAPSEKPPLAAAPVAAPASSAAPPSFAPASAAPIAAGTTPATTNTTTSSAPVANKQP